MSEATTIRRNRRKRRRKRLLKEVEETLPRGYSISKSYVRLNIKYPIDFILRHVGIWEMDFRGHPVRMDSQRYRVFKEKGTGCVECGIKGSHFRLERHALDMENERNRFHFNLYAVNGAGQEVLMTKDHITPKSLGGSNRLENLQPMCRFCNERKGNNNGDGSNKES